MGTNLKDVSELPESVSQLIQDLILEAYEKGVSRQDLVRILRDESVSFAEMQEDLDSHLV